MTKIFLISIDALRYDHLNCYGYKKRITSPFIDSLAKKGTLFKNCFSTCTWTPGSFISVLGGNYPLQYGGFSPLPKETVLVGEKLKEKDFFCLAVHSSPYLSKTFGYGKGFSKMYEGETKLFNQGLRQKLKNVVGLDSFIYLTLSKLYYNIVAPFRAKKNPPYLKAGPKAKIFLNEIKKIKNKNFFAWVHFMDPHFPYTLDNDILKKNGFSSKKMVKLNKLRSFGKSTKVNIKKKDMEDLLHLYDLEIKYVDDQIKFIYDSLDKKTKEDAIFIIAADHGEEFKDHGVIGHENLPYDELIHVPLIISGKNIKKNVIEDLASNIDIPSTILSLANVKKPKNYKGIDLLSEKREHIVVQNFEEKKKFDIKNTSSNLTKLNQLHCYRDKNYKLIFQGDDYSLFDLKKDPLEKNNLRNKEIFKKLKNKYEKENASDDLTTITDNVLDDIEI